MAVHPGSPAAEGSKALSRDSIFGPAPILEVEDASAYEELLAQISSAVKPPDIIGDFWVRDVVDLTWEILRLRRLKISLVEGAVPRTLRKTLALLVNFPEHSKPMDRLIKMWFANEPSAIRRINKYLKSANINFDTVVARTFVNNLESIERIERLVTIAEGRRNAILREIDRRRANFAQMLRSSVKEIEDAEFDTVKPKTIALKNATDKNAA